ncbi:hypothetical protein AYI68_g1552, partial [Smittium mucronatum]
MKNLLSLGS